MQSVGSKVNGGKASQIRKNWPALLSAIVLASATQVWGQTTAPATAPATPSIIADLHSLPEVAPTTAPVVPAPSALTTAPSTATTASAFSAYVGTVTSDRVYVRSGPGTTYYELGQLAKGNLVHVVGQKNGWLQIAPPAGTTAYVVKEFVELDPSGKTGTLKTDYVNLRAASSAHPASDYAVIGVGRKGTALTIVGTTEKYYTVVAPENTTLYVAAQFVHVSPQGTTYSEPTLRIGNKLVPVVAPVSGRVTANTPTTAPSDDTVTEIRGTPTTAPAEVATVDVVPVKVPVKVQPSKIYNQDAFTRFNNLNSVTQAEYQKPIVQRDYTSLLREWEQLAGVKNLPEFLKIRVDARITTLKTHQKWQKLFIEGRVTDDEAFQEQTKALQQTWKETAQKLADLDKNGPLLAEGRLETSTAIPSKYALVNPSTGRVSAYINPSGEIELGKYLNSYIGVRGTIEDDKNLNIKVIRVKSATEFVAPGATTAPATQP